MSNTNQPIIGAMFDPVTGEHKENTSERFDFRGARWFLADRTPDGQAAESAKVAAFHDIWLASADGKAWQAAGKPKDWIPK